MVRGAMEQSPWFWLTEPLAMDFANTIRRRGMADHDYLRTGADLASWSAVEAPQVPRVSARAAQMRFEEIRAFRDDVRAILQATVDGVALPARATARVDARARGMPVVGQLGSRAGQPRGRRPPRSRPCRPPRVRSPERCGDAVGRGRRAARARGRRDDRARR